MGYEVVPAGPEHFAAIVAVEAAAEAIFSLEDLPAALRGETLTPVDELTEATEQGLLWCAIGPEGVVGYAIACWLDDDLHLDEIDVHPDHQQRGVGRMLVDAVRARAMAQGARALTLTTFRDPAWNRPWYARLGFVEIDPTDGLRDVFEAEIARGLARERRVAMRLALG